MNENYIQIEKFKNISYVKDQKGRVLSFSSRYASCFIITLKGRLRFAFGNETVITDPHHGVFIPQGTAYTNECLESAESISVNFFISDSAARPCTLGSINEKLAMSFYEEFTQKAYEKTESAHYYLLSRLYQLAFLLFKAEKPRNEKERLGEKAFSHMQSECGRADLQIDEVAAFCNVSAVYLRKVMKELYEKTPFQLLTEMRMKKAYEMLQEQRPVKEIALSVGYSDIYQFSRAFKRCFGHAPTMGKN